MGKREGIHHGVIANKKGKRDNRIGNERRQLVANECVRADYSFRVGLD